MAEIKQELTLVDNFTAVFDDFVEKLEKINKSFDDMLDKMDDHNKAIDNITKDLNKFNDTTNKTASSGVNNLVTKLGVLGGAYLSFQKIIKGFNDGGDLLLAGTKMANVYGMSNNQEGRQMMTTWWTDIGDRYGMTALEAGQNIKQFSHFTTDTKEVERLINMAARIAALNPGMTVTQAASQLGSAIEGRNLESLASTGLPLEQLKRSRLNFNAEMGNYDYVVEELDRIMRQAGMTEEALNNMLAVPRQQFEKFTNSLHNVIINAFTGFHAGVGDALVALGKLSQTEAFERFGQNLYQIFYRAGRVVSIFVQLAIEGFNKFLPVIKTVVVGLAAYHGILLLIRGVEMARMAVMGIMTTATGIMAAVQGVYTTSTTIATAAQTGLNAAIYAFPGTWIVAAIAAAVAAIAIMIYKINEASNSMGSIYNAALTLGQIFVTVWNMGTNIYNFVASLVNNMIRTIGIFANFLATVFINPLAAIVGVFEGMFNIVLGKLIDFMDTISTLTGGKINFTSHIENFRDKVGDEVFGKIYGAVGNQNEVIDTTGEWMKKAEGMGYDSAEIFASKIDELVKSFSSADSMNMTNSILTEQLNLSKTMAADLGNINYKFDVDAWKEVFWGYKVDDAARKDVVNVNNVTKAPNIVMNISNDSGQPVDPEEVAKALERRLIREYNGAY